MKLYFLDLETFQIVERCFKLKNVAIANITKNTKHTCLRKKNRDLIYKTNPARISTGIGENNHFIITLLLAH